jgi:hypothetical protein
MSIACIEDGIEHELDASIGRTQHNDIIIWSKLYEIKTGHYIPSRVGDMGIEQADQIRSLKFLIYKDQYDKGRSRGVHGYISIMVEEGLKRAAYMGWIPTEFITQDRYGNERPLKEMDRNGNAMQPAYPIPFDELEHDFI